MTFTWKDSNGNDVVYNAESNEQAIEVKHIGAIGTITIDGSGYSGTAVIPCGATPHTVSIPMPFTDPPSTVEYEWTYPPNWSGPQYTSNPSTTVTSNAGGPPGTLTVKAKRYDSNLRVSKSLTIVRPLPTVPVINSPSTAVICSGGSLNLSASASNATSYVWYNGGGVILPNNQSSYEGGNTVTLSATSNGTIQVAAKSSVCQTTSQRSSNTPIYFGLANTNDFNIDSRSPSGGSNPVCLNNGYVLELIGSGGTSFNWTSSNSNTYLDPDYDGSYCLMIPGSTGGFNVTVTATNICGSNSKTVSFYANDCDGGGRDRMVAYPNPATSELTIQFDKNSNSEFLPEKLVLLNEKGKVVMSKEVKKDAYHKKLIENAVHWNVEKLAKGTYFLKASYNEDKTESQRIKIQ